MNGKLPSTTIVQLIKAAFVLVLGILFCFSQVANALSVIIGIALILFGVLYIVGIYMENKRLVAPGYGVAVLLIAFGIMFWEDKMMHQVFAYIPWILIVAGAVTALDAVLRMYVAYSLDMKNFVIRLTIGIIMLALGICLKTIPAFADFTSILIGIVLVVYALLLIADAFLNAEKKGD